MYSLGDKAKNVKSRIIHIEGDPDHPVSRGTLCPKGAGLLDLVHSPNRLKQPEVREAGAKEWKTISWDDAITRIAKHMKADRDANFVEKNDKGVTVNRWNTVGLLHIQRRQQRIRLLSRQGRARPGDGRISTLKRVSDTRRRWPVWPRRSVAER